MYQLYQDDMWGNKVPYMVADYHTATRLMKDARNEITRAVNVPRNVQSLIKM